MKSKTKLYKEEQKKDLNCMRINNTKWRKRSADQRLQSIDVKMKFYSSKWIDMLLDAETETQKKICETMLHKIAKDAVTQKTLVYMEA